MYFERHWEPVAVDVTCSADSDRRDSRQHETIAARSDGLPAPPSAPLRTGAVTVSSQSERMQAMVSCVASVEAAARHIKCNRDWFPMPVGHSAVDDHAGDVVGDESEWPDGREDEIARVPRTVIRNRLDVFRKALGAGCS